MTALWFARRFAASLGVLFVVVLATFALSYLLPVDPAVAAAGPHASPEALARVRLDLGLDRPVPVQLVGYLARLLRGDLGTSYILDRDVWSLIAERLPATLQLAAAALVLELLLGVGLGISSVVRRGRSGIAADVTAVVAVGLPSMWVGYVLLYVLAFLPQQAWGVEVMPVGGGYRPLDLRYVLLPAITLALPGIGTCARLTRLTVAEELRQLYSRTARAKGLAEGRVLWRHALPNALGPVITELGLDLGAFVGGVVIVETVFNWPGIGQLAWQAIERNDMPVVMGCVLLGAVGVVIGNFAADVVRAIIDPRLATVESSL